jgi:hypothetical protein
MGEHIRGTDWPMTKKLRKQSADDLSAFHDALNFCLRSVEPGAGWIQGGYGSERGPRLPVADRTTLPVVLR